MWWALSVCEISAVLSSHGRAWGSAESVRVFVLNSKSTDVLVLGGPEVVPALF